MVQAVEGVVVEAEAIAATGVDDAEIIFDSISASASASTSSSLCKELCSCLFSSSMIPPCVSMMPL
jgi:hypothetical protein